MYSWLRIARQSVGAAVLEPDDGVGHPFSAIGLIQTAGEIFVHIVKENGSGGVSVGQRVAGVWELAAAVEQGIANGLEDFDCA